MQEKQEKRGGQEKDGEDILKITKATKYHTVENILEHAKPNPTYYTLLLLSTLIVTSGLLLDSSFIIIGGILVTPVLSPILSIALGITVGEIKSIKKSFNVLFKSLLIILGTSTVLPILIGASPNIGIFANTMQTAVLYFIVAFSSGAVATFALVRKDIHDILPGVAIAVTLVPPLSLSGIWITAFNFELVRYFLVIFLFNIVGIVIGSLVVFSLLKFYKAEEEVKKSTKL